MKYYSHISILVIGCICSQSCSKAKFLDAKPDQSLVIPTTLSDFQTLLDNDQIMNENLVPDFEQIGSDDYFASSLLYNYGIAYLNLYTWKDDFWSQYWSDWAAAYRSVFYANSVLDGISKLGGNRAQQQLINNEIGSALFYRSHSLWHIAQVFSPPYDSTSAYGIPIVLSSDVNQKIARATLKNTYDQIIADLKTSSALLPSKALYKTRPSKAAALGLLARVYLSMADYSNAGLYADSCLSLNGQLMDYNDYIPQGSARFPFPRFNDEVLFHATIPLNILTVSVARLDSVLYQSYDTNDLRKSFFYKDDGTGAFLFTGSYDGSYTHFAGIAIDEMYFIRAEASARAGDVTSAMNDLNNLLMKRWKTSTFVALTATDAKDALSKILLERRKELAFRGTRWMDIRRLNKEGYGISIKRVFNNQTYILAPNDNHFTFAIPPDVIGLNPGMIQNPR